MYFMNDFDSITEFKTVFKLAATATAMTNAKGVAKDVLYFKHMMTWQSSRSRSCRLQFGLGLIEHYLYFLGSLAISSKPPPRLSSNVTPQHVFNVQTSREIQPVTSPMKGKLGSQRSHARKYRDKEWDAGYRLERKVSDTIKRAGSAIRKTPDLLQNCT